VALEVIFLLMALYKLTFVKVVLSWCFRAVLR